MVTVSVSSLRHRLHLLYIIIASKKTVIVGHFAKYQIVDTAQVEFLLDNFLNVILLLFFDGELAIFVGGLVAVGTLACLLLLSSGLSSILI